MILAAGAEVVYSQHWKQGQLNQEKYMNWLGKWKVRSREEEERLKGRRGHLKQCIWRVRVPCRMRNASRGLALAIACP